jgi:hypothetical protein
MLALNLQPIQRIENTCLKKAFDSVVIEAKKFKKKDIVMNLQKPML